MTYSARNLPPVGACIRVSTGLLYTVIEQCTETRPEGEGDSSRGFVWVQRITERGTIKGTRKKRIYPYEMTEVFSPSRL